MAEAQILPVADLRQHLPRLGEFLSKADFDRLTAILPFFKPQQASKALLSACLDAIATGRSPQEQMADFRAFRQRMRQARSEVVRGITLYKLLVDEWLKRDDGKHHLRPEDKLTLMEEIAAEMWQGGAREWPWRHILAWLGKRLARDEVFRTRYAKDAPELLEDDSRTATFVLRPDDSQESFRFTHTSLQEYFLARYLLQALVDNEPGKWKMPFPSPETLDCLGQLLATLPARERDRALLTLEEVLGTYQPSATDTALRYWLVVIDHDLPFPTPFRVDLHGVDLSGIEIRGLSPEQPLNLVEANRSETQLIDTRFEHVDLSGADLTRAQAERTEFHDVRARDITVTEADMTGAIRAIVMRWDCEVVRRPIDINVNGSPAILILLPFLRISANEERLALTVPWDDQFRMGSTARSRLSSGMAPGFTPVASPRMAASWCRIPSTAR